MFENFTIDQSTSSEINHFESSYALMVFQNPQLETLSIPKLRAIHNGKISLNTNQRLCHWKTLDFRQLLGDDFRLRLDISKNTFSKCIPGDSQCHPRCSHCFDKTINGCQQIYRNDCALQCSTGTCYNTSSPLYCCHKECLGGCTGPTDNDCIACNSMRFGQKCVESCPSKNVYNKLLATYQFDPNGTYSFNRECVQECPVHMRIYRDGCVSRCPDGHYEDDQNCVPCRGACPKTCMISEAVSALNIKDFVNCTKVEGMIEIRKDAFERKAYFWPNM
uniref:receptor protein-tyrosine kinase n=1 Tax=Romanomermis culicivorax TaxID=13658 RepID=A0A915J742_ROMCU